MEAPALRAEVRQVLDSGSCSDYRRFQSLWTSGLVLGKDCKAVTMRCRLYRDYFDKAEKKRRWSLKDDIPWHECNRSLDPAIADVVQTFCAVELYLPDYVGKLSAPAPPPRRCASVPPPRRNAARRAG